MPIAPSAALIAALLVMAPVNVPPGLAAAQGVDPVESLRRQAAKARVDLEKATKSWEDRKKELVKSQAKLQSTLKDLGKAEAELNRIRGPLAKLANAAYQQPGAAGSWAILGAGDSSDGLRAAADVTHMADAQDALIRKAGELQERRQKLASTAQELQSNNAVEQTKLQQQIYGLRKKSALLTTQLTDTLDRLRVSRDRRLELSCDKGLVTAARKYPNGLVPSKYLCDLPQKGETLRADAALGFYKLNAAYKKKFGKDMCVTDSYRSLADQQRIYYQRPGFAAIPGRSNHGLGTALDLCGGVQSSGSAQFNWLEDNSRTYGWFHPRWAYSSPFEPWHWEFGDEDD